MCLFRNGLSVSLLPHIPVVLNLENIYSNFGNIIMFYLLKILSDTLLIVFKTFLRTFLNHTVYHLPENALLVLNRLFTTLQLKNAFVLEHKVKYAFKIWKYFFIAAKHFYFWVSLLRIEIAVLLNWIFFFKFDSVELYINITFFKIWTIFLFLFFSEMKYECLLV